MVLLDKPFVSEFLQDTLAKNRYPVVQIPTLNQLVSHKGLRLVSETEAIRMKENDNDLLIYSNSENAISWIEQNLSFTNLPEKIKLFKNKVAFREIIKPLFPDYFFRRIPFHQLRNIKVETFPLPFIIKPAIGFFSMGVYKVDHYDEWPEVLKKIEEEAKQSGNIYPVEVMNTTEFIVEEVIEGDEFAIDCYFNEKGEPVVLNIMQHVFASGKDVSDRLYFTSKKIIRKNLHRVQDFLSNMNRYTKVKNFPAHIEVRINNNGKVLPIEVNPMRFGGWCSSPDMAWHAFGINEYEYFFNKQKPDWEKLLSKKSNDIYAIVILDNSTGIDGKDIAAFDYDKLLSQFKHPLDMRKTDFRKYPLFGMLFCESKDEKSPEIQQVLTSNLREYVKSRITRN